MGYEICRRLRIVFVMGSLQTFFGRIGCVWVGLDFCKKNLLLRNKFSGVKFFQENVTRRGVDFITMRNYF